MRRALASCAIALASAACGDPQEKPPNDAASPNASIEPLPLASAPDAPVDASAPLANESHPSPESPEPIAPERALAADTPPSHEPAGVTLNAVWRWRDVPSPPKAPEVNADGIQKAQKLTALTWSVDLADNGRMRIQFTSRALPLPMYAEIRARADRFGNVVVWPSDTQYRVVPPGALRTVVAERRVDVTPLSQSVPKAQGEGKRLGVATRKVELVSSLGSLKLEIGKVPEAGDGGALLCRALVELVGVDPHSAACQSGEVPLMASYAWQEGGGVAIEVTSLAKKSDFSPGALLVPPANARFAPSGLPPSGEGVFLSREELAAFRTGALTLPPVKDPSIPGEGFMAINNTDVLSYVLLDGVPAVAVQPGKEKYVIGPLRGRYIAQWRTFMGERIEAAKTIELPARLVHGGARELVDAGAPDAH